MPDEVALVSIAVDEWVVDTLTALRLKMLPAAGDSAPILDNASNV